MSDRPHRPSRTTGGHWPVPAALVLMLCALAAPASASSATCTLVVLHGLPRFTADVYVNGKLLLDGFKPEAVTAPLTLPAGTYHVAIRNVGAAPTSTPVVQGDITLLGGANYTAAAHLGSDGKPTLGLFENDLSKIPAGRSRLVVRDIAAAPGLMVRLDGKPFASAMANGGSASSLRAPGSHTVDAIAAGTSAELVRATPFTLSAGESTVLYVVGSAADGTLDFMVQSLTALGGSPNGVTAGSGGLAAPEAFPAWAAGLMIAAALTAACCIAALRRMSILSGSPRDM